MKATLSDDLLLTQAREGNQQAFRMLVTRHEAMVRGIIGGMLGKHDTEDAAQEVFLKFYRALNNFKGTSSLGTYLGRIAINTALTAIEKQKKRSWLSWSKVEGNPSMEPFDDSQSPERAELRDLLRQALSRLSSEQRSVVVLRLIEGYSVAETAEMLQLPMGTVASRLSRAQKELQLYLKPVLKD